MKKFIYSMMLFFMIVAVTHAQRMLPNQKGLEINTGILSNNKIGNDYYINLGMTINRNNGNYQLWMFEYTRQFQKYENIRIPMQTYNLEGGYSFFLLGDRAKNVTLNFGLTGIVGYETINQGENILYDGAKILTEDQIIYGAGGRFTFEIYLTDQFVFVLQAKTKIAWGTSLERIRPSTGIGLRFNF